MRNLVSYETVSKISPIENADALELASVRGWNVVVRKDEFAEGDKVLYFEIDSFLPISDPRFAFLEPRGVKMQDGVTGHVLRTIKLRGQYSQGLIMPISEFSEGLPEIVKWDPPLPANMDGTAAGGFPTDFCPKTDAERVQNLGHAMSEIRANKEWLATEKIDGTSTTFINDGGTLRVATRNWEIGAPSARFDLGMKLDLLSKLPDGHALQGEYFGENVQSNPLQIKGTDFKAFALYRKTENGPEYIGYSDWPEALVPLRVPILDWELPNTIEEIVAQVDGMKSTISPDRYAEGVVWHGGRGFQFLGNRGGFKAISNKYLVRQK
jgi:RNA ligase (TIGR02306 family)